MNFSNVFVDLSTGFWTYPLLLFWLLCFFSFSPVWVRQWRHKAIATTSKYARWKNFSYNTLLVDATLAVCELSQKSCSNVKILASAIPEGVLARVKIPMISVELPFREMFFFLFAVAKFLAHTSNKLKQIKTFAMFIAWKVTLECSRCWYVTPTLTPCEFHPFSKNNLGYFWPRFPTVTDFCDNWQTAFVFSWSFLAKVTNGESFCFLSIFGQGYQRWKFLFFPGYFWPRIPTVKVLVGLGHFWPRIPMVKVLVGLGHFWPSLPTVKVCFSRTFLAKATFIGHFGYEYQWWKLCLWFEILSNLWHPALPNASSRFLEAISGTPRCK